MTAPVALALRLTAHTHSLRAAGNSSFHLSAAGAHRNPLLDKDKTMNLQDFVKTALVDIVAGVAAARAEMKQHGSNAGSIPLFGDTKGVRTDGTGKQVQIVEFDVALADSSSTNTKGGIGVLLGAVNLGSQGASHGEKTSTSRIKFSVPIVLPGDED